MTDRNCGVVNELISYFWKRGMSQKAWESLVHEEQNTFNSASPALLYWMNGSCSHRWALFHCWYPWEQRAQSCTPHSLTWEKKEIIQLASKNVIDLNCKHVSFKPTIHPSSVPFLPNQMLQKFFFFFLHFSMSLWLYFLARVKVKTWQFWALSEF